MRFFKLPWPFRRKGKKPKPKPKPKLKVRRPGGRPRLTGKQRTAIGGELDKLAAAAGKPSAAKPAPKPALPVDLVVRKPKPPPKKHAKPANVRLADVLATIKIPEARILELLKGPQRAKTVALLTEIIAGAELTNTEKVVARIERQLAKKTFKQIAAELRAEKPKA